MKCSRLKPFLMGVTVGWFLNGFITNVSMTNSYITTNSDPASVVHGVQKVNKGFGKIDTHHDGKDIGDLDRLEELCDVFRHGTNITNVVMEEETGDENHEQEQQEEEATELEGEEMKREQQQQQQPTSVCSEIHSLPSSSSMSIWKSFLKHNTSELPSIYWASKHVTDYKQAWQDFNSRLLYYMTPQRLQTTIKSIPRNKQMDKVGEILDIAYKRYEYVKQKENGIVFPDDYEEPRKVHILVMGGSVTMGVMCSQVNPVQKTTTMHLFRCAWPRRVQIFIDHFFPGIVEVHIITVGGTNTKIATQLWKYNMIPEDSDLPRQPDILINAYSTNDMHVETVHQAMAQNLTLEDMVHSMQEDFIRTVLQPRSSCEEREPPLLLFLDDYLGNEQKEIRKTLSVNTVGNRLSMYYGLGFISYADAVRDFVYGDTDEWWFSPSRWPDRQIHPGMGAHISMMYIVAYNFLNMATTYCDRLEIGPEHIYDSNIHGMPDLRFNQTLAGEPRPKITNVLPPEMTKDLSLDDISVKWRKTEDASIALAFNASECTTTHATFTPCTFAWEWSILNAAGKHILDVVEPYLTLNDGWEETDESKKMGLTPTTLDAKLKMRFTNLTQPVERLNFIVMQSYGEKWAGSKVEVKASVFRNGEQATEQTMEIEGFHAKNTSETFNFNMDLGKNKAVEGDELEVGVDMVGGTTFKIMGMMFCRF